MPWSVLIGRKPTKIIQACSPNSSLVMSLGIKAMTQKQIKITWHSFGFSLPDSSSGDSECEDDADLDFWYQSGRSLSIRHYKPDCRPVIQEFSSDVWERQLQSLTWNLLELWNSEVFYLFSLFAGVFSSCLPGPIVTSNRWAYFWNRT